MGSEGVEVFRYEALWWLKCGVWDPRWVRGCGYLRLVGCFVSRHGYDSM